MPHIDITVPHALTQDEAVRRIQNLPASLEQEFAGKVTDIKQAWAGYAAKFSFNAVGFAVSGTTDVQPHRADIHIDLPLLAMPFKGRLADAVRQRAERLLE